MRSIYEDAEGTLWIGTYDEGLSRFREGRFFNYKVENGLFNNGVFQILEDRQGRFWISCNKGIYRVSRQQLNDFAEGRIEELTSVPYGKADGMLNSECNGGRQPAGLKTSDGRLCFPTMDGVVVIDPDAVEVNELPPPIVIEQVSIDHSPADFSKEVIIQPGQNNLEINYTASSFIKSGEIKFKYRLEGRDAEWTDAGVRRVTYFPYLPPGRYTFRVIAANRDGVWNLEGASLRVLVRAPFYERGWFLLMCAGAVVGGVLLIFRARVNRLQKKQAAQEAFSRQLIESQEQERKRIAAELHDSIGQSLLIIRNWALVGLNSLTGLNPAREYLDEISDTTSQALEVQNTTGFRNSFFGHDAGYSHTTGHRNAFFGSQAGAATTTPCCNSFFGAETGEVNTTGTQNTFLGHKAGWRNTTGSLNSFLGTGAGQKNTTGSNNTVIGYNAAVASENLSYATAIGSEAVVSQNNSVVLGRNVDTVLVPGKLVVTGSLAKGSGSFQIDHPLDPENKLLSHSFVESPDMMNIYNGIVPLNARGEAEVTLPEWFKALNGDFRYQLTAIGAPGPNLYIAEEIKDNHFKIAGGRAGMKVSWQVTGIRKDPYANAHRIKVEEMKPVGERGTYLHPDVYVPAAGKATKVADRQESTATAAQTEAKTGQR